MKHKVYIRYKTGKSGGQHYHVGRKNYGTVPFSKAKTVILYHGTHPKNVPMILKEGILPASKTGVSNWGVTEHKDKIYLTPSKYLARNYGEFSSDLKTDLIKVRLSRAQLEEGYKLSDPMIGKEEVVLDEIKPSQIVGVIKNSEVEVMRETLRENRKRRN